MWQLFAMEHPLVLWLRRKKVAAYVFAATNGIAFAALYKHFRREVSNPKMDTLLKIEAGTGGAVTVKKQMDWLRENGK